MQIKMIFPGGDTRDVPEKDLIQAMAEGGMQVESERYALDKSLNQPAEAAATATAKKAPKE